MQLEEVTAAFHVFRLPSQLILLHEDKPLNEKTKDARSHVCGMNHLLS